MIAGLTNADLQGPGIHFRAKRNYRARTPGIQHGNHCRGRLAGGYEPVETKHLKLRQQIIMCLEFLFAQFWIFMKVAVGLRHQRQSICYILGQVLGV